MNQPAQRLAPKAYQQILELILSSEVEPGEYLNERHLADILGMSRTPVRDALLMLESEGLIVRVGRLGVQIKQMRIEEFLDALEVRKLLEPTICQIAAGRVNCNALKELEIALSDALKMISTSGDGLDRATTRWIDDTPA